MRTNQEHIYAITQEGNMVRALIEGLVEIGSLALFSAMVAVMAIGLSPVA